MTGGAHRRRLTRAAPARRSCSRASASPAAGYHARDEYIEIDSIVPRLYLMTRLLTEIGKN